MRALIDGKEVQLGDIVGSNRCKVYVGLHSVADHTNSLRNHIHIRTENFKIITGGHVYILNFEESSYTHSKPETFQEYLEMKSKGEEIKFR